MVRRMKLDGEKLDLMAMKLIAFQTTTMRLDIVPRSTRNVIRKSIMEAHRHIQIASDKLHEEEKKEKEANPSVMK
jgi:hypothetical protein